MWLPDGEWTWTRMPWHGYSRQHVTAFLKINKLLIIRGRAPPRGQRGATANLRAQEVLWLCDNAALQRGVAHMGDVQRHTAALIWGADPDP